LEFSVGYGANSSYNGDSTGLAVTITGSGAGGGSSQAVHWLVTDHLGTPRMLIDQTGTLATIKRHDYLPFGEELFAGTGGRSAANGYGCPPTEQGCTGDKARQQFTSKERDVETGFDFFGARYYASIQGRFSSADPLLSSGERGNPQTWNRYVYVLNNPLRLIDPNGLDDAESNEQDKQKQVVKPLEDKIIQKRLKDIQSNAQPLAAGERPRPTTVEQIQGEQTILQNATVVTPEGQGEIANGYMQPIALAVLDQGGNIITDPNLSVTEYAFPTNEDAKALYDANKAETTNGVPVQQQPNGVFYDLQVRGFNPSLKPMDIQTKQDLVIKSGTTNLFMIQGNKIRMNDANKSITFTPGTLRKFVN
jgi:RHS repeat-associated protein